MDLKPRMHAAGPWQICGDNPTGISSETFSVVDGSQSLVSGSNCVYSVSKSIGTANWGSQQNGLLFGFWLRHFSPQSILLDGKEKPLYTCNICCNGSRMAEENLCLFVFKRFSFFGGII